MNKHPNNNNNGNNDKYYKYPKHTPQQAAILKSWRKPQKNNQNQNNHQNQNQRYNNNNPYSLQNYRNPNNIQIQNQLSQQQINNIQNQNPHQNQNQLTHQQIQNNFNQIQNNKQREGIQNAYQAQKPNQIRPTSILSRDKSNDSNEPTPCPPNDSNEYKESSHWKSKAKIIILYGCRGKYYHCKLYVSPNDMPKLLQFIDCSDITTVPLQIIIPPSPQKQIDDKLYIYNIQREIPSYTKSKLKELFTFMHNEKINLYNFFYRLSGEKMRRHIIIESDPSQIVHPSFCNTCTNKSIKIKKDIELINNIIKNYQNSLDTQKNKELMYNNRKMMLQNQLQNIDVILDEDKRLAIHIQKNLDQLQDISNESKRNDD